ncbi:MAG TPA: helix-turn-helix transcriptional regulator [Croceibacterium sp.]|nr:helix-turn-helix transcriptional regulator [Croceibacterium sp.]
MQYTETVFPSKSNYTDLAVPLAFLVDDYASMDFGQNLRRLRRAAKLTQAAMAEKLEISQPAYQRWEADDREPSFDFLEKIAAILGVTVAALFMTEDELARLAATDEPVETPERWSPIPETIEGYLRASLPALLADHGHGEVVPTAAREIAHRLAVLAKHPELEHEPAAMLSETTALEMRLAEILTRTSPPQTGRQDRKRHNA